MSGSEQEPTSKTIDLIDRYFAPSEARVDVIGDPFPELAHGAYEDLAKDFDFSDGPYEDRKSWLADPRGVKHFATFSLSPVIQYETKDQEFCEVQLISKRRSADDSAKPTFGIELRASGGRGRINLAELEPDRLLVTSVPRDERGTERRLRESQLGDLLDFGKIVALFREVSMPEMREKSS